MTPRAFARGANEPRPYAPQPRNELRVRATSRKDLAVLQPGERRHVCRMGARRHGASQLPHPRPRGAERPARSPYRSEDDLPESCVRAASLRECDVGCGRAFEPGRFRDQRAARANIARLAASAGAPAIFSDEHVPRLHRLNRRMKVERLALVAPKNTRFGWSASVAESPRN